MTLTAAPTLKCPHCGLALEYHVTIELLNPWVGKIDTGYCNNCQRLFERIRETNTFYETTQWPPLCRACRQPVTFEGLSADPDEEVLYHCRTHPSEQWL